MDMPRGKKGAALTWRRLLPLTVPVLGLLVFFIFDLDRFVTYEELHRRRMWLADQVEVHSLAAGIVFLFGYAAAVAFSLPVSMFLSIAGGLLFGQWLGTVYSVSGATLGAAILFTIAKSAIGDPLRVRAGPWLHRLEAGFQQNAVSYLLVLRLILIFPFWIVNLVPAFLGVSLRQYVLATYIGIIPGTFIYSLAGAGVGETLVSDRAIAMSDIFNVQIVGALIGLILMVLAPVVFRWWKSRAVPL